MRSAVSTSSGSPSIGNVLTARVDANVEQRLEILDVLVVNAKQRFQTRGGSSICFK